MYVHMFKIQIERFVCVFALQLTLSGAALLAAALADSWLRPAAFVLARPTVD